MRRVAEQLLATHPFYACWYNLFARCEKPGNARFTSYGGRGITISERWRHFAHFYEDMFSSWRKGLSIERRDNSQGYSKENCYWATQAQQGRNKRNTKLSIDQVNEIRRLYKFHTNKELSQMFGVSAPHICKINSGKKWADV